MKIITSVNPGNNYEVIGEVEATEKKEVAQKVSLANEAKNEWGRLPISERVKIVNKLHEAFRSREEEIGNCISKEVGTPINESKEEVRWDRGYAEWFLNNAHQALSDEILFEDATQIHKIVYEPVGSVAVITPWNLPYDMFIWGVIPNLLAGNTVIYKAAEECVLTGKLFEDIADSAGLPSGVLSFVHGDAEEGNVLVHEPVDMIWFTGSSTVGKELFALAGKKFIRSVMEMGGSNPAIIFDDADIDTLLSTVLFKRFSFCGQTCDAVKRVIIHESRYEEFVKRFSKKILELTVGRPEDESTQLGPLVSKKQLDLLLSQVDDARAKGATIIIGGVAPENLKGAYLLPTLIGNVTTSMRVWHEEVFGPVLSIVSYKTEEEAVTLANDTEYGLGALLFTKDLSRIERLSKTLQAGNIDVNGCGHFKPYVPFGGYKSSGMGREHGVAGFRELCQIKTVSIKK